jgi:hypothetical protein
VSLLTWSPVRSSGRPPSPEVAPVAEAGEPLINADIDPSATQQAGEEAEPEAPTNPPDSGSAADPKTEQGTT